MGDKSTYGKATVQVVQEVPGTFGRKTDGALKVTQSKFYRPAGTSNQKYGVQSNINIPSILEAYEIGEDYLDYALPPDSIPPAKGFKPLQNLSSLIAKIQPLSKERMSKNLKYQEIIGKIDRIKKDRNKFQQINKELAKIIDDQENSKEQREKEDNENIINSKDLQIIEALNVTLDSIKLSENKIFWVGMSK